MSSSSAYNNVLLNSPVQTQAAAAPKRASKDDYSHADFSQTFKDLNANAQRKIDKSAKSAVDKAEATDRHKAEARDTRKLAGEKAAGEKIAKEKLTGERLAGEKLDRENIARKKANEKIDSEKAAKESNPKETVKTEASDTVDYTVKSKKSVVKTDAQKDSKESEATNNESPVASTSVEAASKATPESSLSPLALTIVLPTDVIDKDAESTVLSQVAESIEGSQEFGLSEENNLLISETSTTPETEASLVANAVQTAAAGIDDAQLVAADVPKVIDGKTSAELAENQANVVNSTLPKTSVLKSSASDISLTETSIVAEENLAALPDAETLAFDKTLAASNKEAIASNTLAKTDAQQANVTEDPKTVFEKMLQTVSKSAVREESAPATPLQNSTTRPATSLTDSFARFSDAQSPATRGFVVQTAVPVPVGQPQWSQAVGEKVLWLAAQNVSSAEINLHPKDLGPMQVRVSVNQEQTTVSFTSHHPMVREVLDQNLNRLRDMFSEQGLNLVNVDVSDKSFSRQHGESKEQKGHTGTNSSNDEETLTAVSTIVQKRLVDHYA